MHGKNKQKNNICEHIKKNKKQPNTTHKHTNQRHDVIIKNGEHRGTTTNNLNSKTEKHKKKQNNGDKQIIEHMWETKRRNKQINQMGGKQNKLTQQRWGRKNIRGANNKEERNDK